MSGILVAGIGNIFNGDDAFGVEVARVLSRRHLPECVRVVDFGIRGIDLTYALLDGYDAVLLVDAAQTGEPPGAVSVIEPEHSTEDTSDIFQQPMLSPHELDPASVLRMSRVLGSPCRRVILVACEPYTFGGDEGVMGLSPVVAATIEPTAKLVEEIIANLISEAEMETCDLAPNSGDVHDEYAGTAETAKIA